MGTPLPDPALAQGCCCLCSDKASSSPRLHTLSSRGGQPHRSAWPEILGLSAGSVPLQGKVGRCAVRSLCAELELGAEATGSASPATASLLPGARQLDSAGPTRPRPVLRQPLGKGGVLDACSNSSLFWGLLLTLGCWRVPPCHGEGGSHSPACRGLPRVSDFSQRSFVCASC